MTETDWHDRADALEAAIKIWSQAKELPPAPDLISYAEYIRTGYLPLSPPTSYPTTIDDPPDDDDDTIVDQPISVGQWQHDSR